MRQSDVITAAADVIAANGGQDGPVRAAPHARNPGPVERDLRWIADELVRGGWPNPQVPRLFTLDDVHRHSATGQEDMPCLCGQPGTYARQAPNPLDPGDE